MILNRSSSVLLVVATLGASLLGCASDSETDLDGASNANLPDERDHGAAGSSGGTDGSVVGAGGSGADEAQAPPPEESNDQFDPVGTNPFVVTAHDPFSTFAADVDTASYDLFVRDIGNGQLPNKDSVRLEEFVNYFDYAYDAPAHDAEVPFTISIDATPHVLDRETSIVRVGIQAKQPPPTEKKPANLVFLIDISGSMSSSEKLPLVKSVLTHTLDVLDASDTVSIVTYAGSTGVALEPTPVSSRSEIESKIESFSAGGSTAGGAGITLAYEQAGRGFIEGGINHVILCTDGDFNVGISGTDALVELIEDKRKTGITLTVLGFGSGNLNDAMMEKVSNAGNGVYGVITSESHARDYAKNRMLSSLHHVAKDMKIQVEFNPLIVEAYRLLGYENRAIADDDFRDDTVDAGEVGAGHRVTAMYEVVLEGVSIPAPNGAPKLDEGEPVEGEREVVEGELVRVKVRYKAVDATESDPAFEVVESLLPSQLSNVWGDADNDLQWVAALAGFAELLKQSPFANLDDLERIQSVVDAQSAADSDRGTFADLFAQAKPLLRTRGEASP